MGPDARGAPARAFIKLKHGANSRQLHGDGKTRGWPAAASARLAAQKRRWHAATRRETTGAQPAMFVLRRGDRVADEAEPDVRSRGSAVPNSVHGGFAKRSAGPGGAGQRRPGAVSQLFLDRHHRRGAARADGARAARVPVPQRASRTARGAAGPGHRAQHPAQQRDQDGGGPRLAARGVERDLRAQRRAARARAFARRRCPPAVRWRRGAVRAQLRGARRCSGRLLARRTSDPAHAAVA